MKKVTKIAFPVLLTLVLTVTHANPLDGWWVSDHQQRLEIKTNGNRLLVTVSNYRQTETFLPVPGRNAYRSQAGDIINLLTDDRLEMSDRRGSSRTLYYKEHTDYGYDYDRSDREEGYSRTYRQRLNGDWFNSSTGLRLQIVEKNHGLKVRFQRDRWTLFTAHPRSHELVDDQGNTITLDRQGNLIYRSAQRDLIMTFTQGFDTGRHHNPFFEDYNRHFKWN